MLGWNEEIKKEFAYCGENVFIGHNTMFANPQLVRIEDRVRIDPFCWITTGLRMLSNSHICAGAYLIGGGEQTVYFGEWTALGYGAKLFTASEDYSGKHGPCNELWGKNEVRRGDIVLDQFCTVASGCMLFPGVVLPQGTAIGAMSLVHSNRYHADCGKMTMSPWTIYAGNPLRFFKHRDRAGILRAVNDPEWVNEI